MENIVDSQPSTATTTPSTTTATTPSTTPSTTTTTTTRRLRSLHLPSSSSTGTNNEISRRFTSLRRPTTTTSNTQSPLINLTTANNNNNQDTEESVAVQKVQIKLVPNVGMTNRCFVFDVVDRELELGGSGLKLGRYSDRTIVSDRLSFKSKDSGSSSGTFVNHIRLTAANTESTRPHQVVDGDLIQLGVDYKGGLEPMYRAVRMRLEVDRREWQESSSSNTYSLAAFQQLKNQINTTTSVSREEIQECCICLYCIAPFQALFIAPCSHIYHYRCLRPLLNQNYPGFSCPLCRTYSNLEASVAVEENEVLQMLNEDEDEDNSPLITSHNREKTVLDEDSIQESSSSPSIHSSVPLIRPSVFLYRQISSSDGGLAATLVGSPPRFDAGGLGVALGEDFSTTNVS
ncbi:hypothetical protein BD770DRAFT_319441 [Pilaira anomala]|nr:hypothetical protein BD770DRAFT_319441 [Pilaira anomala]